MTPLALLVALLPSGSPAAPVAQVSPPPREVEPLSWRFVEGWVAAERFENDPLDDSFGVGARGAWSFGPRGEFLVASAEHLTGDTDIDRFLFGGGIQTPLDENVRLYAQVAWVAEEISDEPAADIDEDGWRAQAGIRALPWEALEVEFAAGWHDVVLEGFYGNAAARWWITERVALTVEYERLVDDNRLAGGLRLAL